MADYTKLKDLVDSDFTVTEVGGYQWKMWDQVAKQMLVSDVYEQGYRKVYAVLTNKGSMDLSASQLAQMLEGVSKMGRADVNGWTFHVKSNGKTDKEIRYYINPKSPPTESDDLEESSPDEDTDTEQEMDLDSIPF